MRKLVPLKASVTCRKVRGGARRKDVRGISAKVGEVDVYEILSVSEDAVADGFPFKPGDFVMSNSTGDEIEANPGETVYLFKTENIMCRLEKHGETEQGPGV